MMIIKNDALNALLFAHNVLDLIIVVNAVIVDIILQMDNV